MMAIEYYKGCKLFLERHLVVRDGAQAFAWQMVICGPPFDRGGPDATLNVLCFELAASPSNSNWAYQIGRREVQGMIDSGRVAGLHCVELRSDGHLTALVCEECPLGPDPACCLSGQAGDRLA